MNIFFISSRKFGKGEELGKKHYIRSEGLI